MKLGKLEYLDITVQLSLAFDLVFTTKILVYFFH